MELIICFLGSTHFQNIILFITVWIALYTYRRDRLSKAKTAASNILLYKDELEKNIDRIPEELINKDEIINEKYLFYSNSIINYNDEWQANKNIIKQFIDQESFNSINEYFLTVNDLNYYLKELKNMLIGSLYAKSTNYYNCIYNKISNIPVREPFDLSPIKYAGKIVRDQITLFDLNYIPPYICIEYKNAFKELKDKYRKFSENRIAFKNLEVISESNIWEDKAMSSLNTTLTNVIIPVLQLFKPY